MQDFNLLLSVLCMQGLLTAFIIFCYGMSILKVTVATDLFFIQSVTEFNFFSFGDYELSLRDFAAFNLGFKFNFRIIFESFPSIY